MNIIGIDIGEKGVLAVMTNGQIQDVYKMPWGILSKRKALDVDKFERLLNQIIDEYQIDVIALERASMHLQSQKTSSAMWFSYGLMIGVIKRSKIKYIELDNKTWQKEFGIKGDTKAQSISICEALFPTLELRFERQKANTKNNNISDAVLIAEYVRRKKL